MLEKVTDESMRGKTCWLESLMAKRKSKNWLEIIWINVHGMFMLPGTKLPVRHFKIVLAFSKLIFD